MKFSRYFFFGARERCPWNEWTCTGAAANKHLEVLQWARRGHRGHRDPIAGAEPGTRRGAAHGCGRTLKRLGQQASVVQTHKSRHVLKGFILCFFLLAT